MECYSTHDELHGKTVDLYKELDILQFCGHCCSAVTGKLLEVFIAAQALAILIRPEQSGCLKCGSTAMAILVITEWQKEEEEGVAVIHHLPATSISCVLIHVISSSPSLQMFPVRYRRQLSHLRPVPYHSQTTLAV